ncbi:MAG: lipoyl(octanoyl) transferase [Bacteroidetes bacterium GWF2_38_335]|nr:MAG: lipoyl(octanoyl) transferase [Bacteroidetes bacterium GWF2_38_335]OFY77956.1 MAG: lipoyl(octanoyl) transferase [Bacteroidetes bacterium RIFOXYA12_FULL_38_20]HBS86697.1 lipoate--protein ligase [Bacteroidales bacterium]
MPTIKYTDLGLIDYKEAWDFQERIFNESSEMKIRERKGELPAPEIINHLLFCEHPHVYTLGKSGKDNNLLIDENILKRINASFYRIDRGGDITYHGPGQLVGYPVFDLEQFSMQVKQYIHSLEEAIILSVGEFGIKAERLDGATGVWIDVGKPNVRKICAIGVKAGRNITMHGFALNVNTNLDYFRYINPCGFIDKGVTSIQKETGREISMDEVKNIVREKILKVFA